jgi:hypothetical protein
MGLKVIRGNEVSSDTKITLAPTAEAIRSFEESNQSRNKNEDNTMFPSFSRARPILVDHRSMNLSEPDGGTRQCESEEI